MAKSHCHGRKREGESYAKATFSRRAIAHASAAVGHDGFQTSVGVLDRLRAVGVRDNLGRGNAVGVIFLLRGRAAGFGGFGGNLPLRDAGGELDVVVFLAGRVPLGDPAGR